MKSTHYENLDKALILAAKLHSGQRRDGEMGLPYSTHPFEVVSNLRNTGGITDENVLTAAALHDLVEETTTKLAKIRDLFGEQVGDLVREVTRQEPSKKETKDLSREEIWQLRSSMLLSEIAKMSHEAQSIKLADRLSNIRDAKRSRTGEKLERYQVQTYEILETIPREVNPALWDAVKHELE